ncbi:MAG: hypothetical protein AB7P04_14105, partial [Bacteriovoracia bacterium]
GIFTLIGCNSTSNEAVIYAQDECVRLSTEAHTQAACKTGVSIAKSLLEGYKSENHMENLRTTALPLERRQELTEHAFSSMQASCGKNFGASLLDIGIAAQPGVEVPALKCLKAQISAQEYKTGLFNIGSTSDRGFQLSSYLLECNTTCTLAICQYFTNPKLADDIGRIFDLDLMRGRCDAVGE